MAAQDERRRGPVQAGGAASDTLAYRFGDFTLGRSSRALSRYGVTVPLGSRAAELLLALVENRDRVVGKDELIRIAWPRSAVDRNSLPVAIFALRQIFKDMLVIRNVYGQGYQFAAPVLVMGSVEAGGVAATGAGPSGAPGPQSPGTQFPGLGGQPSIVVLPFVNAGGDSTHDVLGEGIAEGLIGALSRNRWLRVVARNSTFSFRDSTMGVVGIAQRLGARYVLEGTVRCADGRVRVTALLNDAETETHLVSERYDRVLTEIFAVQDEITGRIVDAVRPVLFEAEQARSLRTHPDSVDAWTAYQRGIWYAGRWSDENLLQALGWFDRAIALDARYAPGHYGAAMVLCRAGSGYSPVAPADWQARAGAFAAEAVRLDPRDPGARVALGWTRYMRGERLGAIEAAQHALALNPGEAAAYALMGAAMVFDGRAAEGIEALQAGIDLDPYDPRLRVRQMQIGLGLYFMDDLVAAEALAGEMLRAWPEYEGGNRLMGLVLAETDRSDPALRHIERAVTLSRGPFDNLVHARMPWYREAEFRRVVAALQRVGWNGPSEGG